jgi:DNA-directed RNA polymerase specialized sigma24 family protein
VDEALATLKPEQALILRLRLEGGGQKRKFKEIGELVGISEEAAERAYLRAKEKVKDYVKRRRGAAGDTTSRS